MPSNPVATITNNLDCDVDIYDVFNPNTIADPGTSDMQQNMVDSFQFIKYMQANPSTALAKGFRKALGDENSPTDAINTFFKGTGSFQQCNFTTWNAVFTWQSQFVSPWQGTYYLYSTDSTAITFAPTLVATLAITTSAAERSAVLAMAAMGGQSTAVAMPGDGSMQEQNIGTGNMSVLLNPAWLNVLQTSQQTGDSYTVIGAAFTGTIDNMKVAGNLNQLVIPSLSDTSPRTADILSSIYDYSNKLGSLVDILTGATTVLIMFKESKAAERQRILDAQGATQTETDAKAKELKIKEDYKAKFQFHFSEKELAAEDQASQALSAYDEVVVAQNILLDMTAVAKEGKKLENILNDGGANLDIEETASDLADAENILAKAEKSGMSDEKEAEQEVTKVNDEVKAQAKNTENVEEKEQAEDNKTESDIVDRKDFDDAKPQN
ncbi:hypothetical protein HG530_007842 [Fusarium avenaceum]|nr:hypothetical protein HG530_007842 [Fusarium avenaceum]